MVRRGPYLMLHQGEKSRLLKGRRERERREMLERKVRDAIKYRGRASLGGSFGPSALWLSPTTLFVGGLSTAGRIRGVPTP